MEKIGVYRHDPAPSAQLELWEPAARRLLARAALPGVLESEVGSRE